MRLCDNDDHVWMQCAEGNNCVQKATLALTLRNKVGLVVGPGYMEASNMMGKNSHCIQIHS